MKPTNLTELYESRVLVLMESEPQSSKYHQLFLNAEEFKKLSDLLQTFGQKTTCLCLLNCEETREYNTSDTLVDLKDYQELKTVN